MAEDGVGVGGEGEEGTGEGVVMAIKVVMEIIKVDLAITRVDMQIIKVYISGCWSLLLFDGSIEKFI